MWRNAWSNKKDGEGLYFNWRDMLRQANISFDKNSKFFQNSNSNENNMIEESVIQFLNNFFDFND